MLFFHILEYIARVYPNKTLCAHIRVWGVKL